MNNATGSKDPNFPDKLDISPSTDIINGCDPDGVFGEDAQKNAIQKYGIAGRVWEAAYVLLSYIRSSQASPSTWIFDPPFWSLKHASAERSPFTMIELGAGVGIVSAAISEHLTPGKDIIIATDLPEVCNLLVKNLGEHHTTRLSVRPLAWGHLQHIQKLRTEYLNHRPLTHIICSDLVYFPELLGPLLRSLIWLTAPPIIPSDTSSPSDSLPFTPEVIISHKIRSLAKETPFWSAFGLWFEYHPVLAQQSQEHPWDIFHGSDGSDSHEIFVFVGRRRPESLHWTIPEDDSKLMNGVDAGGTSGAKIDSTFESILFSTLDYGD